MGRQVFPAPFTTFRFSTRKGGTPFPVSIHPSFPNLIIFTHSIPSSFTIPKKPEAQVLCSSVSKVVEDVLMF
jgi:hypothetical protein